MKKECSVMGRLGLLLLLLALIIAGCSSKPVCKEGQVHLALMFVFGDVFARLALEPSVDD